MTSFDIRYPDIFVQLSGTDGNAYSILGAVNRTLVSEATAGDYYHLLATAMRWVDCG